MHLRFELPRLPVPALLLALTFGCLTTTMAVAANLELPSLGEDSVINIEREQKLGRAFYERLLSRGLVETQPLLDRYINDIGFRLLAGVDNRVREYRFFIVRDDAVNAFAVPGGYIGINRGLIFRAQTQHQLASVIAHEIAHVRLRHGLDMMEKGRDLSNAAMLATLAGLLLGAVDSQVGAAVAFGGAAGTQQSLINFTRENEYEADRFGIGLMTSAGFDPKGTVEFFQIITSNSAGGGFANIEYLRTHPLGSNRIAEAAARAASAGHGSQQVDDYQLFRDYLLYSSTEHLPDQGSPYLRALASVQAGDYQLADDRLSQLYRADDENIWYGIAYAENLERLNQKQEAERVYRRLLNIFPGDYALSMRLMQLYKRQGQGQEALKIARDLEIRFPEDQQVYFELSEVYEILRKPALRLMAQAEYHRITGNYKQAIRLYDQVLQSRDVDLATESKAREKRLLLLEN